MAQTDGSRRRSNSDIAIIGIILLLVIALLIWFISGRPGGDDGGVDIDVSVPEVPG